MSMIIMIHQMCMITMMYQMSMIIMMYQMSIDNNDVSDEYDANLSQYTPFEFKLPGEDP